jgi:16S rRNA (cytosine967-C5)-methyltransferase
MTNKPSSSRPLSPRQLAVRTLNRVDEQGSYAEPLLDSYLSAYLPDDIKNRKLVTQIVYGTLRMRGYLDWMIEQFYHGSFPAMDNTLKNILRTAAYQLFYMDRIPSYAVVNEAVRITESAFRGRGALVNALLRNIIRRKDTLSLPEQTRDFPLYIAVVHSHPQWLVEKWIALFGEDEAIRLCSAFNEIPPVTVRVNTLKDSREAVLSEMCRAGWEAAASHYSPDGIRIGRSERPVRDTPWFGQGRIQIQDEGSQLISRLVDPQPGDTVLDLCAGTGGKTAHLAALMRNRGKILAVDNQEKKLESLQAMNGRLGVNCVEALCRDGRESPPDHLLEAFDCVLVDAPCTGLGTLKRNPEIKWRLTPAEIVRAVSLQSGLLDSAARYLKRGGRLVYSTCSLLPEENEEIIRAFLSRHDAFRHERNVTTIPGDCLDRNGFMKTLPHRHGMDGFFAALLIKSV